MSSDSCLPDAAIVDIGRMGGRRCGGRRGSAPAEAAASPFGSRSAEAAFSMVPHTSQMEDRGLFSKVHAGHLQRMKHMAYWTIKFLHMVSPFVCKIGKKLCNSR